MVQKRLFAIIVSFIFLISFSTNVLAIIDLIALQGNVQQSGVNLGSGDLQVAIFDAASGGNLIYNSTTDFYGNISSGKYDVMLGSGTNEMDLEYGKYYYLELYINGSANFEKFTFDDGSDRQRFQSSVGNISIDDFDFSEGSQNLTLESNEGWFKGLFNWVIESASEIYLVFNGTTLEFNETKLNDTIGDIIGSGVTSIAAENVTVQDSGDYYNASNAEEVFQEIGGSLGVNTTTVWKSPVIDKDLSSPPGAPSDGDRYIVSGSANWYSDGWIYRRLINSTNAKVAADETNALVRVEINGADDIFGNAQSDGDDILVTDSDGQTKLDHYLEVYDETNQQLALYVNVPTLESTTDHNLYIYYNNSNSGSMQVDPLGNIFPADYGLFYDMNSSDGGLDLTSNGRNFKSNIGTPTTNNSNYGVGTLFGSGKAWSMQDVSYWEQEWEIRTHNIVFQTNSDVNTRQVLFAEGGGTNGVMLYILNGNLYSRWWCESRGWSGAHHSTAVSADTVYYVTMSYANPGNYALYVNGAEIGSTATTVLMHSHTGNGGIAYTGTDSKDFHDTSASGQYFLGAIREFFVADSAWNENKHDTWYNNRGDNSGFWTIGSQSLPTGATGDWASHDNDIAEYNTSAVAWNFQTPETGWAAYVTDEGISYWWNGVYWGTYSTGVFHNTMAGLQGGKDEEESLEYYHLTENQHTEATRYVNESQTGLMTSAFIKIININAQVVNALKGLMNTSIPFVQDGEVTGDAEFRFDPEEKKLVSPNLTVNESLGIGVDQPSAELDVRGKGNFSSDVYIDNATRINDWTYNMTEPAVKYVDSDINMNVTSGDWELNFTGGGQFKINGGWQSKGITISGGDIYLQTVYVVNITSLAVSHVSTNGSLLPTIDNEFDLGASGNDWQAIYIDDDLYLAGTGQKKWWYNQTASSIYFYNQTDAAYFNYNHTTILNSTYSKYWINQTGDFWYNQTLATTFNYNHTTIANLSSLGLFSVSQTNITELNSSMQLYFYNQTTAVAFNYNHTTILNDSYGDVWYNQTGDFWYNQSAVADIIKWQYNQSNVATVVNWTTNGTAISTTMAQVGIGTATPSGKLHLVGTAGATDADAPMVLNIVGGTGGAGDSGFSGKGGNVLVVSGTGGAGGDGPGSGGNISIISGAGGAGGQDVGADGGNIYLTTGAGGTGSSAGSYGNVIMAQSGGKVGIGTTTPTHLLDIYSDTAGVGLRTYGSSPGSGDNSALGLLEIGGSASLHAEIYYSGGDIYFDNTYNNDAGYMYFRTKTSGTPINAMTILGSGHIGIGTTPEAELHVYDGTVDDRASIYLQNDDNQWRLIAETDGSFRVNDAGTNIIEVENGATNGALRIMSGGVIINEASNDLDFRVESDTSTDSFFVNAGTGDVDINNTLYVDASANGVGIGTSAPKSKFHIKDTASGTASTMVIEEDWAGAGAGDSVLLNITGKIDNDAATAYGLLIDMKTSAPTSLQNQYGLYVNVSGATNNYAAVFADGSVGIGETPNSESLLQIKEAPGGAGADYALNVSGNLFVNSTAVAIGPYFPDNMEGSVLGITEGNIFLNGTMRILGLGSLESSHYIKLRNQTFNTVYKAVEISTNVSNFVILNQYNPEANAEYYYTLGSNFTIKHMNVRISSGTLCIADDDTCNNAVGNIILKNIAATEGGGGNYVCIDGNGVLYKSTIACEIEI